MSRAERPGPFGSALSTGEASNPGSFAFTEVMNASTEPVLNETGHETGQTPSMNQNRAAVAPLS